MKFNEMKSGDMKFDRVDEAIEGYASERMTGGRTRAGERFMAIAYLKNSGADMARFMQKSRSLAAIYASYARLLENPFKSADFAFFLATLPLMVTSSVMMCHAETRLCGILVGAGAFIAWDRLLRVMLERWRKAGVMAAIYDEIVAFIDQHPT